MNEYYPYDYRYPTSRPRLRWEDSCPRVNEDTAMRAALVEVAKHPNLNAEDRATVVRAELLKQGFRLTRI